MTDDELDWKTKRDMETAVQTGALAELGFGPAFAVTGGLFGGPHQFASCELCGAMVALTTASVPDQERPLYVHWAWHAKQIQGGQP